MRSPSEGSQTQRTMGISDPGVVDAGIRRNRVRCLFDSTFDFRKAVILLLASFSLITLWM